MPSCTAYTCSRRTVFRLFLVLLDAPPDVPFSQRMLRTAGVDQFGPGRTLLKDLELITPSGRLDDDVVSRRHDPQRLKSLLHDRICQWLKATGCTDQEISFLGQDLSDAQLAHSVAELSLVRQQKSDPYRSAAKSCVNALNDVLLHLSQRDWFDSELRVLDANAAVRSKRSTSSEESVPSAIGAVEEGPPRTASGAHQRSIGPSRTGRDVLQQVLDRPVKRAEICEADLYVVDFGEDGASVHASVSVEEGEWTVARLRRLSRCLLDRAAALEQMSRSSSGTVETLAAAAGVQ